MKENQHTLYEDICVLFNPPFDTLPLDDRREAQTIDNGHGRRNDTRHLKASTDAVNYINWPGLAQVFRLERSWEQHGETKREVQYGTTSLPSEIADSARLLELKRGHWPIENGCTTSKMSLWVKTAASSIVAMVPQLWRYYGILLSAYYGKTDIKTSRDACIPIVVIQAKLPLSY